MLIAQELPTDLTTFLNPRPICQIYPAKLRLAVRFATPRIRFLSEPPPLQTTHTSIYENGKSSVAAPHPIRSKLGMSALYGLMAIFIFNTGFLGLLG